VAVVRGFFPKFPDVVHMTTMRRRVDPERDNPGSTRDALPAPRRRRIRYSHSLGGICSGGWGMRDHPVSADEPDGVARHGRTAHGDDDEPVLDRATKLIIAVAVFALGVPMGAAIAAWVMPPS
jgi:hypothetical protein